MVTFLGVIILDVDIGLYIGLGFSLLLIIVQSQRALTSVMGNIPYTDIYESIDICDDVINILLKFKLLFPLINNYLLNNKGQRI